MTMTPEGPVPQHPIPITHPKAVPAPNGPVDVQVISPYGVGIDTHSKFIQVCVMYQHRDADGTNTIRQSECEFTTRWPDLIAARDWVLGILGDKAEAATLRYCIESTGTYHFPVLKAWRGIPSVVNPLLAGASHRKTDVLDARTLAHHSITGLWKASFIPTETAQVLRVIWARRREMTRRATRAANQLNNIILRFGFTFGADTPMRSAAGESILSDIIEGQVLHMPGAPPEGVPPEVRPVLGALLADLRSDLNEAKHAEVTAANFVKSRDWPTGVGMLPGSQLLSLLQTVPGVGALTALTWLSEITDPNRFANAKQVAAFAGCDPSLKVSAGKVTSYVRRQGNLRLHQALLYAAAGVLRRADDPLGAWGRSIAGRHKKGGHKKACAAVARRLACALWEVHRRAVPFSYAGYTFAQDLTCPLTPLGRILNHKAVLVLRAAGIRNSHQLAEAYNQGKLAAIQGFGETSIAAVKQWVMANARRTPKNPSSHPSSTPSLRSGFAGPAGPANRKGKVYALSPSLVFKKQRRNRKADSGQDTQTQPEDNARRDPEARAPRAARTSPGRKPNRPGQAAPVAA